MYKLLVVDDEKIVRDSIEYIVSNNFEKLIEIETAKTGYEAIEKATEKHPDMVFMDINMPGINGIETLKEIKSISREAECFIISAYEQFNFAQEAIKLEVTDYILKPITKNKIIEVLEEAIKKIKIKRSKKLDEIKSREKMEKVLPSLEQNFIFNLLLSRNFSDEVDTYIEIFDIKEDGGFILILSFVEKSKDKVNEKFDFTYSIQELYQYLRNNVKFKVDCIFGPLINNRVIIFIPKRKKNEEYFDRLMILEEAKKISQIIKEKSDLDFAIGIGGYSGIYELKTSYDEALKAILFSDSEISYVGDIKFERTGNAKIKDLEKKLVEDLKRNRMGNIEFYADEICNLIEEMHIIDGDKIDIDSYKISLIELLAKIYSELTTEENFDKIPGKDSYIYEAIGLKNNFTIKNWLKSKLVDIVKFIQNRKETNYSENIKNAVEYIYNNYRKEISLEIIAGDLFITPQYLSKLFKDETGKNFIDFLTTVRIERAKELLENSDYTIKEICYEIGYNDPNYFSRIFKKEVKITPKEYRKKIK